MFSVSFLGHINGLYVSYRIINKCISLHKQQLLLHFYLHIFPEITWPIKRMRSVTVWTIMVIYCVNTTHTVWWYWTVLTRNRKCWSSCDQNQRRLDWTVNFCHIYTAAERWWSSGHLTLLIMFLVCYTTQKHTVSVTSFVFVYLFVLVHQTLLRSFTPDICAPRLSWDVKSAC